MGRPVIDLTGQRFGRLVVTGRADPPRDLQRKARWRCTCDCGREVEVYGYNLSNGNTASCGCLQVERSIAASTTHGQSGSRLYATWCDMLQRCENPHNPHYSNYGERGIAVCEEWHIFANFMQWAERTGYQDDLTIDRIDVNEGYNPVNCRWATVREQNRNKRNNVLITYCGITRCLADWAITLEIHPLTLWERIFRYHWDVERAFTTPVQKQFRHHKQEEQAAS